ncbi:uncharacterized protein LOC114929680 isoform X2 [Nylanderia fulva]|uniref:uncharacterized protein LOC114929680 isoform X2 n=1 Tax=Nylanderia fulva TaxID=613905 RepID=UPI0010FAFC47|nr:uncharacterized protein LOC114929680 isoform X2 [Nylanderia fulva]
MYEKNHVFWYCAFLLVASSSQDLTNDNKENDSTVLYEVDINSMKNLDDDITTMQYILRKISTKDIQYDDMQNESSTMSNYWQNDNSKLRNELTTHFIENHWNENQILMESQQSTHITEINDKKNFTTQEIHENGMKIEDNNSSTSHDILKNFNTNNKNNFVPHEMCGNIICIQLCCPIGEHLNLNENCIAEENEYIFSNLNRHINNLLQNKNKRMDRLFHWTIRKPYDETEFIGLGYLDYNATCFSLLFCYLATCFWLTVMSFDMWWTFRDFNSLQRSGKQQERKKMILYSLYAWGSSFICTIICVIINFIPCVSEYLIPPKLGILNCWFNALKITRYEKDTAQQMKDSESRLYHKNKKWFKLYFKLFVIVFIMVGVTWIMAILFWKFGIKIWHQFLIYSMDMMQSFGIFIVFVCKKTIKQQLLKQFGCQNCSVFPKIKRPAAVTKHTNTTTLGTTSL